ncbi:unnamed protein product [Linum tenue]|uniref:Uncharacterized protein n=1 Tax=Linum tenue TaxID=586396 RepID=A0AAV0P1X1_9ROSI|nr:unnamed protein product [Linum tenue]
MNPGHHRPDPIHRQHRHPHRRRRERHPSPPHLRRLRGRRNRFCRGRPDLLRHVPVSGFPNPRRSSSSTEEFRPPCPLCVYDPHLPWCLDVAKTLGFIGVAFFTQSCAVDAIFSHVHDGLLNPLVQTPEMLTIPGLTPLKPRNLASFVHDASYPAFLAAMVGQFSNIHNADWVLCNLVYELETEAADWPAKLWAKQLGRLHRRFIPTSNWSATETTVSASSSRRMVLATIGFIPSRKGLLCMCHYSKAWPIWEQSKMEELCCEVEILNFKVFKFFNCHVMHLTVNYKS